MLQVQTTQIQVWELKNTVCTSHLLGQKVDFYCSLLDILLDLQYFGPLKSKINNYFALSCIVYVASSYLSLQQVLDFSPRNFEYVKHKSLHKYKMDTAIYPENKLDFARMLESP